LFERAEDGRRTKHHWGHDCIRIDARLEWGLFALERAKVVTGARGAGSPSSTPKRFMEVSRPPSRDYGHPVTLRSSLNCDLARGNRFTRSELIIQGAAYGS
jgi:hypothetical protein